MSNKSSVITSVSQDDDVMFSVRAHLDGVGGPPILGVTPLNLLVEFPHILQHTHKNTHTQISKHYGSQTV